MIHFKYGFEHKEFIFGWHKKELYRLPSESEKRNYPMKKLSIIKVGKQDGYRIKRDKFSLGQIQKMTIFIDKRIYPVENKQDTPF